MIGRIFIYEFLSGGGLFELDATAPLAELAAEGRAMAAALAYDFARIDDVEVTSLCDARIDDRATAHGRVILVRNVDEAGAAFDRLAAQADWTVVIAPETDGHLAARCRRVVDVGGRLLGPGPTLVELAGDKQATARYLTAAGVAMPQGIACPQGPPWPADFTYPAVWKPRDGAGSQGLRYIARASPGGDEQFQASSARAARRRNHAGRLEPFCPGLPASVAVLAGPAGITPLVPCRQVLSDDGRFRYLGGSLPLGASLAARATKLALQAATSLPQPLGYLGIDLVLGAPDDGCADVVIEVNPRLTTSYLGLRAACEQNLAEAMLAIAQGEAFPFTFRNTPIEFATGIGG